MNSYKLYKFLDSIIGCEIDGLIIDNNQLSNKVKQSKIIQVIDVNFLNNKSLSIYAEDIPHFMGEGDLSFSCNNKKNIIIPDSINLKINQIRVLGYKPKGFNIFPSKNIVQIEFIENPKRLISIGFYLISLEPTFMGEGNLALNFNRGFNLKSNKRISILYNKVQPPPDFYGFSK